MVVGAGFNSPATQAAIAKQSAAAAPAAAPVEEPAAVVDDIDVTPLENDDAGQDPVRAEPRETPPAQDEPGQETETGAAATTIAVEDTSAEGLDAALSAVGLEPEAVAKAVADNNGKFPDDIVAKLKEAYNEDQVDEHIAAVEKGYEQAGKEAVDKAKKSAADVEAMNTYIFETLAGGDAEKGFENFNKLSAWAKANLPDDELAAINVLLQSGNKKVVNRGLTMAVDHYKKGQEKRMMTGDPEATNRIEAKAQFKPLTKGEFFKLMATDKYKTDPDYAKEVDTRRAKTLATENRTPGSYTADLLDQSR